VPIVRHVGVNSGAPDCSTEYGFDAFNGEPAGAPAGDLWAEPASPTALYGNHGQYVSQFGKATKDAESAGFVLAADAKEYKTGAAHSDVGH
jgi:alpha/beta hydrolase family protein